MTVCKGFVASWKSCVGGGRRLFHIMSNCCPEGRLRSWRKSGSSGLFRILRREEKRTEMRKTGVVDLVRAGAVTLCMTGCLLAVSSPARALDPAAAAKPERSPWAMFRFGFSAYKSGHKDQAVEAYRYAAENGQLGARWKLARMYAEGDGVTRNEYRRSSSSARSPDRMSSPAARTNPTSPTHSSRSADI